MKKFLVIAAIISASFGASSAIASPTSATGNAPDTQETRDSS